ncbi:MAG: RNA polymerase sigma factor, partial [Thermoguttaceae bacterium]
MSEEKQLIAETIDGNAAAFGKLVIKHQDRLYNTMAHIVGNAEDARDIVQDAFVQAFLKLDTFKGKSEFYTWLYRIAWNLAAGERRRRRTVASIDQNRDKFGVDPPADCPDPAER